MSYTFTNRGFYTQTLLHTDAFTRRCFYTHTHTFTHRGFYTQTLLHTGTFTHRSFYTLDKNGSLYDPAGTESWNMQTSLDSVVGVLSLAPCYSEKIQAQVRPGDQPGYPKDTIESFVGHSSMGLLWPPALKLERERTKEEKERSFTSI